LFGIAVISAPANALPVESNEKSAASIGQLDAEYHSACRFRLSASFVAVTNTVNVADVIVAPSGNPDVSNRNSGTYTVKLLNANRRPAVNTDPDTFGAGDPDGGYPADCALLTVRSPSSPPAPTENVIDPDVDPATTTAVCADVADADPPPFDAVTTARNVDPTSPDTTPYDDDVAPPISTHPPPDASHRRH
jgi:hypothetical protein